MNPEHDALHSVSLPSKDVADPFETAYFKLLTDLMMLIQEVPDEVFDKGDVLAILGYADTIMPPVPPRCDCGHEFSQNPWEFHLDTCAWRKFKTMP